MKPFLALVVMSCGPTTTKADAGRVYDTRFGRVLCAREYVSACGVNLSQCHDAKDYLCLIDVRGEN